MKVAEQIKRFWELSFFSLVMIYRIISINLYIFNVYISDNITSKSFFFPPVWHWSIFIHEINFLLFSVGFIIVKGLALTNPCYVAFPTWTLKESRVLSSTTSICRIVYCIVTYLSLYISSFQVYNDLSLVFAQLTIGWPFFGLPALIIKCWTCFYTIISIEPGSNDWRDHKIRVNYCCSQMIHTTVYIVLLIWTNRHSPRNLML